MTVLGRFGHRLVATEVVSLARLKWFAIVLPFAALVGDRRPAAVVLPRLAARVPGRLFFLAAILAVCVFAFASVIFALIEDLRRESSTRTASCPSSSRARIGRMPSFPRCSPSGARRPRPSICRRCSTRRSTRSSRSRRPRSPSSGSWRAGASRSSASGASEERRSHRGPGSSPVKGFPARGHDRASMVVVHDRSVDPRFAHGEVAALGLQTFCALPSAAPRGRSGCWQSQPAVRPRSRARTSAGCSRGSASGSRSRSRMLGSTSWFSTARSSRSANGSRASSTTASPRCSATSIRRRRPSRSSWRRRRSSEATIRARRDGRSIAREVYADVREAIVGLRGAPAGLVPAIRDYLPRLPRARLRDRAAGRGRRGDTSRFLLRPRSSS